MSELTLETRLPPNDLYAEQVTLGCMLWDAASVSRALSVVSASDFYREAHRHIYEAIVAVNAKRDPVDIATVGAELRRLDRLEGVGGAEYMDSLRGQVPTFANLPQYASVVREKALLREVIQVTSAVGGEAYEQPENVAEFCAEVMGRLRQVATQAAGGAGSQPTSTTVDALVERVEGQMASPGGIVGARFGIPTIDRNLGGLQGWGLLLVRADTKHGKSLLTGQAALASAQHFRDCGNKRWVFAYILEAVDEWNERALAWLGNFRKTTLEARGNPMTEEEEDRYGRAVQEYATLPLTVSDKLNDIERILLDVEQQQLAGRVPGLILVDHAQRIKGGDGDVRNQKLADVAEKLARLAVECKCPVLLPSQVTIDQKSKERTSMHSRGLDQEASLVIDLIRGGGDASANWGKVTAPISRRGEAWWGSTQLVFDGFGGTARIYDEDGWKALGREVPGEETGYHDNG